MQIPPKKILIKDENEKAATKSFEITAKVIFLISTEKGQRPENQ